MRPLRSLLIVKVEHGATAAAGLVFGAATPAWTTQRAVYGYWVTCHVSTSSSARIPAAVSDSGGLLSAHNQSPCVEQGTFYLTLQRSGEV